MNLNPAEISELIKSRIEGLSASADIKNQGTVVSVTDGIVRVHGLSDATIESAYPIDASQLADVRAALEKRFARKLNTSVVVKPELIGGIRVVVGDEVLDTSVAARLQQMKTALVA